jgi:hypothetical protein
MQKIAIAALFFILCVSNSVKALPLPEAARQEIGQLLNILENSGCQFKRNESWYTSQEAQVHLHKKLEYLLKKEKIVSAEQFIALAASQSSISGRPYMVQCPGIPQVESKKWLAMQLQHIRASQ